MDTKKMIGYRITNALAANNCKQKDLAQFLNVPDNTISYFCSGKRTPNTEQIIKIAQFLNVSTDYLLGLSEASTDDAETQNICDYLGISEKAVNCIKEISHRQYDKDVSTLTPYKIIINNILESSSFSSIIEECLNLVMMSDNNGPFFTSMLEQVVFDKFADMTRYTLSRYFDEIIDMFDSRKNKKIADTIGHIFNNKEAPVNGNNNPKNE